MEPTDQPWEGINTEVPTVKGDSHSTVDGPPGRVTGEDEIEPLTTSDDGAGKPDASAASDPAEADRGAHS
jgi:hypothetical protein